MVQLVLKKPISLLGERRKYHLMRDWASSHVMIPLLYFVIHRVTTSQLSIRYYHHLRTAPLPDRCLWVGVA